MDVRLALSVPIYIGFKPPPSTELEQLEDQCAEHMAAHSTVHLILFYCLYGASMPSSRRVAKTLTGTLALDESALLSQECADGG